VFNICDNINWQALGKEVLVESPNSNMKDPKFKQFIEEGLEIDKEEEKLYTATQWQLMWRKFRRHKLAIIGLVILAILYTFAIFCEFFAPQDPAKRDTNYIYVPPQKIHFIDESGRFYLRPFVYGLKQESDPITWRKVYVEDRSKKYPVYFFVHGDKYRLWNLIEYDLHFIGTKEGPFYLFGTDESGRDMLSRTIYGARISLFTGLIGVFFSFIFGCILGGISGYFGGSIDLIIQRVIEFLLSLPSIPLWMALAAAMPKNWSPLKVYFLITVILSLIGWCSLARVVRGKILELRELDFVTAARLAGATDWTIITKHLLPNFTSYLIVSITLAIPNMILGETSLSFLGIGLRPPIISWGVLLKNAQNISIIALQPWFLIPGLFIVITVLAFNFLGDGLRDAADPYR
jgi:peptide/nickel transport system permease protein